MIGQQIIGKEHGIFSINHVGPYHTYSRDVEYESKMRIGQEEKGKEREGKLDDSECPQVASLVPDTIWGFTSFIFCDRFINPVKSHH